MALTFGFYDSLNHDRLYNAQQMSAIFDGIINDGVFASVGSHFSVVPGTGMHVLVKSGRAWFNSTWTLNDSDIDLTIDAADTLLGRIDTVVLEVNSEQATRANSIKVVKGTAASSPVKPTLTNTATVHQHPLAHVTVAKNTTAITASMIEIVVGKTDCPFVTAILQTTDITNLFAKWENDFQTWFSTVRSTLDGDVALNLQNQIDVNWRNTLKDATKMKLGLASDAVPDDAFNALIEDVSTTFDIGDVKITARNSLDDKWLLCNGALLDYDTYLTLYNASGQKLTNKRAIGTAQDPFVSPIDIQVLTMERYAYTDDSGTWNVRSRVVEPYISTTTADSDVIYKGVHVLKSGQKLGLVIYRHSLPRLHYSNVTIQSTTGQCLYVYDITDSGWTYLYNISTELGVTSTTHPNYFTNFSLRYICNDMAMLISSTTSPNSSKLSWSQIIVVDLSKYPTYTYSAHTDMVMPYNSRVLGQNTTWSQIKAVGDNAFVYIDNRYNSTGPYYGDPFIIRADRTSNGVTVKCIYPKRSDRYADTDINNYINDCVSMCDYSPVLDCLFYITAADGYSYASATLLHNVTTYLNNASSFGATVTFEGADYSSYEIGGSSGSTFYSTDGSALPNRLYEDTSTNTVYFLSTSGGFSLSETASTTLYRSTGLNQTEYVTVDAVFEKGAKKYMLTRTGLRELVSLTEADMKASKDNVIYYISNGSVIRSWPTPEMKLEDNLTISFGYNTYYTTDTGIFRTPTKTLMKVPTVTSLTDANAFIKIKN